MRRLFTWASDAQGDLLYAIRTLIRAPWFAAVAILTLGLAIGAVTLIYSVVHNVVVDPLPYRDADRLVNVLVRDTRTPRVRAALSPDEFVEYRDRSSAFEDVIGTLGTGVRYETKDAVEYLRGVWVTPNFFEFMGLPALLGRTLGPADVTPGAPHVVVLRHRAWLSYFGGAPGVIGSTIILNGEPRTVVGVMPPRFTWHAADLWIPRAVEAAGRDGVWQFQARLAEAATVENAEAQLNAIAARRARERPAEYFEGFRVQVVNVIEYTVGSFTGVLYAALGAVGLLLLIACCNVANMLLARGTTRERELTIRAALGAHRGRIVRQLLVESLVLAVGGAAVGSLLAWVGIGALVARLPQNPLPGEVDIALNGPVLLFGIAAGLASALIFGVIPALYAARRDLVNGLKGSGRGTTGSRSGARNALVAAEIALSIVLLTGAGLLTRTFVALTQVELGFDVDRLLVVPMVLPATRADATADKYRFYEEALQRISSVPGVQAAAVTTALPPFGPGMAVDVDVPGGPAGARRAVVQWCTPGYFSTLGLSFLNGSQLGRGAPGESPRQAVVNRTFAAHYFPTTNPVGRSIRLMGPPELSAHPLEIVGVVEDVRNRGVREPPDAQMYVPWSAIGRGSPAVLVRTSGEPSASARAIRAELAALDRQVAVLQMRSLREMVQRSIYAQPRFSLLLLGIFSAAGALLVAAGVFSAMAYTVSRATKELAIRMALGATRSQVYRVVFRLVALIASVGVTAGVLGSLLGTQLLASQLWSVSPRDPATLIAAATFVLLVAMAACYIPARRAASVDPVSALKVE